MEGAKETFLGVTPFESDVEVGQVGVELVLRKPGYVERRERVTLQESVAISVPTNVSPTRAANLPASKRQRRGSAWTITRIHPVE